MWAGSAPITSERAALLCCGHQTGMRILDAFLNGYFVFLVLLFVTGGYIPPGKLLEERVTFELSKMDHWVAGFVLLLILWWAGT